MANNPDLYNAGKGTHFSATNQPKKRGKKPRQLKRYLKETGLGINDQVLIFESLIATHTADELKTMIEKRKDMKGEPLNALVWGFLIAWWADNKRGWSAGGINAALRDRKYGKVPEKVHTTSEDITDLPQEERDAIIREYFKNNPHLLPGSSDTGTGPTEGTTRRTEEAQQKESGEAQETNNQ